MKVILTADLDNLGDKNDVVEVAGGYARNYLLPRGLAQVATKGALRGLEVTRRIDDRKVARLRDEAQQAAQKLASLTLRVPAKTGPSGRLFGSVTSADLAERLAAETGVEVDRRKVALDAPLKSIGTYTVPVTVFKGVVQEIAVEVFSDEVAAEEPEDAQTEQKRGIDEEWADEIQAAEEYNRRRARRHVADLPGAVEAPEPVAEELTELAEPVAVEDPAEPVAADAPAEPTEAVEVEEPPAAAE